MQPDVCFSGEADYRLAWIKGPTLILCLHKNLCGITMTLIAWMIMAKKGKHWQNEACIDDCQQRATEKVNEKMMFLFGNNGSVHQERGNNERIEKRCVMSFIAFDCSLCRFGADKTESTQSVFVVACRVHGSAPGLI